MKRIRQNVFGNWNGYEGRRFACYFDSRIEAEIWLGVRNADGSEIPGEQATRTGNPDWRKSNDYLKRK